MKKLSAIIFSILFLLLANTTAQSQVTFNKTYGQMPYNYGKRILQAWDGGYYLLANENGDIANTNIHIIRIDSLGVILFERTIGDASIYSANDFIRTADKGFLITGLTNKHPAKGYDVLLVKTDSNAVVQWEKTYGGADWDMGNSVIETKDNAYLISGQTFSYGPAAGNIYVIKTNLSGDTLWTKVFGGDSTDNAMSADIRYDSTYLIGATTNSFGHGSYDGYVLNLDLNGDTLWTATYGQEKEDIINSIKQTPDSGFVFVGSTMSYNAVLHDGWLAKYDKNRNFVWMLPESWNIQLGEDVFNSVFITDSAQYAIAGYTTSFGNGGKDAAFYLMGEHNQFKCSHTDGSLGDEEAFDVIQTRDSAYAMIGNTNNMGNGIDNIYLVKMGLHCSYSNTTQNVTGIETLMVNEPIQEISVMPTVSTGKYTISLPNSSSSYDVIRISDLQGRVVFTENITVAGDISYLADLTGMADGLYFITICGSKKSVSFKVIKSGN
jgi:hypothetical protein